MLTLMVTYESVCFLFMTKIVLEASVLKMMCRSHLPGEIEHACRPLPEAIFVWYQ